MTLQKYTEDLAETAGPSPQRRPELSAGVSKCTLDMHTHAHTFLAVALLSENRGQKESVMCCGLLSHLRVGC